MISLNTTVLSASAKRGREKSARPDRRRNATRNINGTRTCSRFRGKLQAGLALSDLSPLSPFRVPRVPKGKKAQAEIRLSRNAVRKFRNGCPFGTHFH